MRERYKIKQTSVLHGLVKRKEDSTTRDGVDVSTTRVGVDEVDDSTTRVGVDDNDQSGRERCRVVKTSVLLRKRCVGREGLASCAKSTKQPRLRKRAMTKTRQLKWSDRHEIGCRRQVNQ